MTSGKAADRGRQEEEAELTDRTPQAPDRDSLDLGALDRIVGYHLRRASAVISADFARTFAETGMRQVPFGVLAVIAANPGTNQGAVGRALGIKRANMVALVTDLMAQGLVERAASSDRRAFALRLTDAGQATLVDALARIERHEDRLLARLTSPERDQLAQLLARIAPDAD